MRSIACALALALISASWPAPALSAVVSAPNPGASGFPVGGYSARLTAELQGQLDRFDGTPGFLADSLAPGLPPERADAGLLLASALAHQQTFLPLIAQALGAEAAERLLLAVRSYPLILDDRVVLERAAREADRELWDSPEPLFARAVDMDRIGGVIAAASRIDFDAKAPERLSEGTAVPGSEGAAASVLRRAEAARPSEGVAAVPDPKKAATLPRSFWNFLWAIFLASIGQAIATAVSPLLAYGEHGEKDETFTVESQALSLIMMVVGGWAGAWWVRRFGAKSTYRAAITLTAAAFAALVAVRALFGLAPPSLVLVFSALNGITYGSTRGVAEQTIATDLLGKDRDLLTKANTMYYILVSPAYIGTMLAMLGLMSSWGMMSFIVIGTAAMFASLVPLAMIKVPPRDSSASARAKKGKKSLPLRERMPYLFFWPVHMDFWYLSAPFLFLMALGAGDRWLTAAFAAYSAGSLARGLVKIFKPQWIKGISKERWAYFGLASALIFFFAPLLGAPAWLATALAIPMGVGVSAGLIEWKSHYQEQLVEDKQPAFFRSLNDIGLIVGTWLPFAFLYGGKLLFSGVSMPGLLAWLGGAMAVAALAVTAGLLTGRRPAKIVPVASPEDVEEIRPLLMEYWRAYLRAASQDSAQIMEEVEGKRPWPFVEPNGRMFRSMEGDRVAGIVGVLRTGSGRGEIRRFYVSPSFRSGGHGGALMEAAIAEARALGIKTLRLETHPASMADAVKFYHKYGFTDAGADSDEFPGWVWMELDLAPTRVSEVSTAEDFAAVRPLLLQYRDERRDGEFVLTETDQREISEEAEGFPGWPYSPPAGYFLRAQSAGDTIGHVALTWQGSPGTIELRRFYVLPEHRKGGNGSALLKAAIGRARGAGAKVLRLSTHPAKTPEAVKLYERMGFRETGPYVEFPGWVWMELKL